MSAASAKSGSVLRGTVVGAALGALLLIPVGALARVEAPGAAEAVVEAAIAAVDAVGFVLIPQLALAVFVLGLAVHRFAARAAGLSRAAPPGWLGPAVESALLLGMLGTIAGMVRGFSGLDANALEPGPLIHSLGTALRSSFVGFAIALVGVWLGPRSADTAGVS